ncbi:MAG: right-handed parallel beta-helix repeat-containing protein, partial [Dehalococcoidia bacterium]|nr:right-handed parallel beta-helix repeat-containing protein [Dehalococcoidia bacterium]
GTVDASANWWGTTDPTVVAGLVSTWVDFTPMVNSGADADPGTPGWQPNLSSVTVHTLGQQVGATGRVQEGVNLVTNSTVDVVAGTYIDDENGDGDDLDANEGGLVADIYKSNLTLQSTDGPAVTIIKSRGTEGDGAVRIRGADDGTPTTGVTVDGFTVYNTGTANSGAGIFIGGWFAGDMGHPANNNTVKNCIIGSDTDQSLSPTNGVYLWNTTGNLIQSNIIYKARNEPGGFGCGIMAWGGLVGQAAPSPNTQLIDNEIYDSDRFGIFIGAGSQQYFDNVIIRGNAITGSGSPGIGLWNVLGCDTIHINFNNIYDNVHGIWAADVDADVDATLNWWGNASGPSGEGTGSGDAVSTNVIYSPWLGIGTDANPGTVGWQLVSPMLIIVDDVGPAPAGGYLGTAIDAANNDLPGTDTIEVRHGTYADDVAVTDSATIISETGSASNTHLTGNISLNAAGILLGRLRNGFSIHGNIDVGAGIDASTIHINWNNLYAIMTNNGLNTLDATYNYWGAGSGRVGDIDYRPFLPETVGIIIGYMDDHGMDPLDAIAFSNLLLGGSGVNQALVIMAVCNTFPQLSQDDVEELIDEYGWIAVHNALLLSNGDYEDFVTRLIGYGFAGTNGGILSGGAGGGGASGEGEIEGTYSQGETIHLSF